MQYCFRIGSIFHQEGYSFNIHHLVAKTLMSEISKQYEDKDTFLVGKPEHYLHVIINTGKEVVKLDVKKSGQGRKNKYVEYVIYIPFDEVNKYKGSIEINFVYLDFLKKGLEIIFNIHEVEIEEFEQIFENLKSDILINPEKYKIRYNY